MTATKTDKTGVPTTVTSEPGRFTISVDGRPVGFAEFTERAGRRTFFHTEVDPPFQGRGLATIVVAAALEATRDAGLRIVAPCSMVADYLEKSGAYDDLVDPA
jgi:predicted GNAT family acetyltransferase